MRLKKNSLERVKLSFFFISLSCVNFSCSSAPNQIENQWVAEVYADQLRVRRPNYESAAMISDKGQLDYQTAPESNSDFGCKEYRDLFSDIDLKAVTRCFKEFPRDTKAVYLLRRETEPYFELLDREDKETPKCLVKALPVIPLPREIFYIADFQERRTCFSSRLDLEAGRFLGIKMPFSGYRIAINSPLPVEVKTEQDTLRYLIAITARPFFAQEEKDRFKGKTLPNAVCKACFKREDLFEAKPGVYSPKWP